MTTWRCPLAWRRRATARAGAVTYIRSAIVTCLELPSIPGFQSADRLPPATVWPGPGARLRNVNAAAGLERL